MPFYFTALSFAGICSGKLIIILNITVQIYIFLKRPRQIIWARTLSPAIAAFYLPYTVKTI